MAEKTLVQIPVTQRELFDKGLAALQKNNLDYAVTLFVQVLKAEPGFYECREALRAAQYKRAGSRGGGLFKKLLGSANTLTSGRLALRSNPLEAIQIAEEALNQDPSNMQAHDLLADAALQAHLPKTALLSLEVAFKANPSDRRLAEKLVEAHTQLGNQARAEKLLRDLISGDPNNPALNERLKNLLALRTLKEGGYDQLSGGTGSYRDVLRDKEQAKSLEQEHREVKDVDVVERLITEQEAQRVTDPANPRILRSLADLYLKKSDFDRAIGYYEQILSVTGMNDPLILQCIRDVRVARFTAAEKAIDPQAPEGPAALEALRAQRQDFLLADAQRRAEANPTDLLVRFELGELHFKAGRWGDAIGELQKAQNNPNRRIAAMGLLARAFFQRGMNDMAARKLQEALKEKPIFDDEAKDLTYHLGIVLEKMNRPQEAIEQFKLIYEQDIAYRDVMARVDQYYASQG
jgi:tetratricopeptide (TPR) repeat protein